MSKEQAKGFFEAISKDKQLAEEVKDVMRGQATNQEKAKELLSLAKAHNFNFTEDELKTSLSIDDLADVSGGMWSLLGRFGLSVLNMLGLGGGGNQPAPQPVAPIVNVQQMAGNAQNQDGQQEDGENEAPPAAVAEENEVEEIRELTPEEIAERQQREEQLRREREARLAQGPLEMEAVEPNWFKDDGTNRLIREFNDKELMNRVNRLNTLYYRLLYAPQGRALMDRIRNYTATVGFTFDRGTESLQEQISIAGALIHEAEEMLQSAEQQRGEEIAEELREEIQHGLDALALILQRMHIGRPGETDLYTDVQTFLANRESYSRQERKLRAGDLLMRTKAFHKAIAWCDRLYLADASKLFKISNEVWRKDDAHAVLEEQLENNALPWLKQVRATFGIPGERGLALEIQEFLATIDEDFTDEHLERLNELLDRARELMMNRARAYTSFDTDQMHILNNDLQLAQMLGIDKEYIQEKIKNKTVASREDIEGFIELPDGDEVAFHFFVGSGTLVLTGSGDTVIGHYKEPGSLWKELKGTDIVFGVLDANGLCADEQLPTPKYPFVVRNLIIGEGISKIDSCAFVYSYALRSLYFLDEVTEIGFFAFLNALSNLSGGLIEVGFVHPEAVKLIDVKAFAKQYHLQSINLPQNANIHESAFSLCDKLKRQGCPYCK